MSFGQIDNDPPAFQYVGASHYDVELEMDLGSDDFMNAVIERVPLPDQAVRWIALWSIRQSFERAYTGERKTRQLARMDKAIAECDCRLVFNARVGINDDGDADTVDEVSLSWECVNGEDSGEIQIPNVGDWLHQWIKSETDKQDRS